MSAFVLILPDGPSEGGHPPAVQAVLHAAPAGWDRLSLKGGGWLFRTRRAQIEFAETPDGHRLIGRVRQARAAFEIGRLAGCGPGDAQARLVTDAWGAYVHVHQGADRAVSALRDPSGALETLIWRRDEWLVIASDLPNWCTPLLPRSLTLDWDVIGAMAARPGMPLASLALHGIEALAPGEAWAGGHRRMIWRPSGPARRKERAEPAQLADAVDTAVCGLGEAPVLMELSGGLDSSIVAAAWTQHGGRISAALNYHVDDPEGDERDFARQVAERLGAPLTFVPKSPAPLDLAALARLSNEARPAHNAFDQAHDQDVAARCAALGIATLLTGQGGDDVFFQTPTPRVAADALRVGTSPGDIVALARWQKRSVYRLLREAAAPAPILSSVPGAELLSAESQALGAAVKHPWLSDLDDVPPAKQLQILGLLHAQAVFGASERSRAVALRHPLLAQPVVELCLAIPTPQLTRGGRDRGFAREAFADRLPRDIVRRTAKGRLSAYYGRTLALSLADLRPLLLDGRLVERGVVLRTPLEERLTASHLITRGGYGGLIHLILLELWVRAWRARLAGR